MADIEQFTEEQAQKLLEEMYPGNTPAATPAAVEAPDVPVEAKPEDEVGIKPAVEAAPAAVVEDNKPAVVEDKKDAVVDKDTDPYAWVGEIPDTLRDKVLAVVSAKMQAEHRIRSDDGRVRAMQQRLLEAQKQIALREPPAAVPAPASAPASSPEGWADIAKSDPELAKAIEARVKSEIEAAVSPFKGELQELRKTAIAPLYDRQTQQYAEQQWEELQRQVPNVADVIKSTQYSDWLNNTASEGVRKLALSSIDHQDAISVLRQYAFDMQQLAPKAPVAPAPAAPAATVDTSQADAVAAARDAKLKAQTLVAQTPLAPTGGDKRGPMTQEDAEELLKKEWARLTKKT